MAARRFKKVVRDAEQMRDAEATPQSENTGVFAERHFTVAEVAAMWSISVDACRRIFRKEPGVVVLGKDTLGSKRRYRTLRIPQSVLQRVHRQHSIVI